MRRRRYVDAEGLVTLKGRVAAEVQSADELLLTELLFTGVFQARFMFQSLRAQQCKQGLESVLQASQAFASSKSPVQSSLTAFTSKS